MPHVNEDYLIPIVVGVVGRKGARPAGESISSLVISEMQRLRNTFPSSPFVVMSSLSGSEDRLLVRLAAEHLDAKPIAVLTSPPGQYRDSLHDDKSREEFSELLGPAGSSVDISSLMRSRLGEAAYGAAENRGMAKRFAAAFIAEHSEVLFAVSGNGDAREPDTSALIVKWMREGGITREYSLRVNKSGLDTMDRRMIITIDPAGSGSRVEYTRPMNPRPLELQARKNPAVFPPSSTKRHPGGFSGLSSQRAACSTTCTIRYSSRPVRMSLIDTKDRPLSGLWRGSTALTSIYGNISICGVKKTSSNPGIICFRASLITSEYPGTRRSVK